MVKIDNRPWIPQHIPSQIRKELYRRTLDQGFNYVNTNTDWSNYKNYRGPLSPWIRVTSNGTGAEKPKIVDGKLQSPSNARQGFVLYGGTGFNSAYGTTNSNGQYQTNILGYDTQNKPHVLDTIISTRQNFVLKNFKHAPILLPPPGIVSIEANVQKELFRKVTINWKCYNFAQLEYMAPYFLTPGISMIVEYGWNLFNYKSLLDLTNIKQLEHLKNIDPTSLYDNILNSNGMYDVTFGTVANYEFGTQDGFTYDCKTEIYSNNRNYSGVYMKESPTSIDRTKENIVGVKLSLYDFCNQRLKNVVKCLEGNGKNFFDSLSTTEKEDPVLKNQFYGGKNENRIFIPRNKLNNDPLTQKYEAPDKKIDWDSENSDNVWVTMGFLVELVNLFIGQNIKTNSKFSLYTLDIDDVIIGAHPNLMTADGFKLLIPNPIAPKYNLGSYFWVKDAIKPTTKDVYIPSLGVQGTSRVKVGEELVYKSIENKLQYQTSYTDNLNFQEYNKNMKMYDEIVYKIFKTGYFIDPTNLSIGTLSTTPNITQTSLTVNKNAPPVIITSPTPIQQKAKRRSNLGVYRDNLSKIINRFRLKDAEDEHQYDFPQIKPHIVDGKIIYNSNYWGYLKDLFINVDVILEISNKSSTAVDFFNQIFKSISEASAGFWELAVVEDDKKLKIVDKKFISPDIIYNNLYQFDISSDSCIKSLTFSVTPSNAQMAQVIASSTNNQSNTVHQNTSNQLPNFKFGDRLNNNLLAEDSEQNNLVNDTETTIKQLQKAGKVPGTFAMSLKNNNTYEVVNLALPNVPLLLSILNDNDYENNMNIYGGQQPNFTCELTLQGIAGLRTFQCFSIKNLPKPYSDEEVLFQVVDVTHSIQNGEWTTTIKAGLRPIYPKKHIKRVFSNGKDDFEKQ